MDRVYQANAVGTPPTTVSSSGDFPTAGSQATGQKATVPGAYWFYSVTEEIRNALIAAGVAPDPAKVNQLAEAMAKFLPLSGGTMTAAIVFSANGPMLKKTTTDGDIAILGGTSWDNGAHLELCGKDKNNARFILASHDGTNYNRLIGDKTGSLTWNENEVITSAGGKITGTLYQDGSVRKSTNNGYHVVMGGSNWEYGAYLQLNGSEYSSASDFCLASRLNGKHIELRGKNDGTLMWDGHHVLQYLNPSVWTDAPTDGTAYTIPWDCYGFFECTRDATGSGTMFINVNGATVTNLTSDDFSNPKLSLPLKKGQTLEITTDGRLTGMSAKLVAIGG